MFSHTEWLRACILGKKLLRPGFSIQSTYFKFDVTCPFHLINTFVTAMGKSCFFSVIAADN